jgi:hypothetical protein
MAVVAELAVRLFIVIAACRSGLHFRLTRREATSGSQGTQRCQG